jgi:hypothetical protein
LSLTFREIQEGLDLDDEVCSGVFKYKQEAVVEVKKWERHPFEVLIPLYFGTGLGS